MPKWNVSEKGTKMDVAAKVRSAVPAENEVAIPADVLSAINSVISTMPADAVVKVDATGETDEKKASTTIEVSVA